MNASPKTSAVLCAAAAAWLTYSLMTATEAPSTAMLVLQLVVIAGAIAGFIGAMKAIVDNGDPPSA